MPSLALIAFFIAFLGVGFLNVTVALALLAIPPILTNVYVGVTQVDRDVIDAAVGQGMTGGQVMREIELPLAGQASLPSIPITARHEEPPDLDVRSRPGPSSKTGPASRSVSAPNTVSGEFDAFDELLAVSPAP